jgi:ATP-dependent protease ClpP protease subunit
MTDTNSNKARAEARKLDAETVNLEQENLHKEELRKHEIAEKKLLNDKLRVELAKLEQEREAHALDLQRKRFEEQVRLAGNDHHRVYRFTDAVTYRSVGECTTILDRWHRMSPGANIEVVFTSPGGAVYDGLALGDHMRSLSRQGHRIITGAEGFAASMAGILLQFGDHRWIGEETYNLFHEISSITFGNTSEQEDQIAHIKMIQDRQIKKIVSRAVSTVGAENTLTVAQFRAKWKKTDWWLDSTEMLKLGYVDEVR